MLCCLATTSCPLGSGLGRRAGSIQPNCLLPMRLPRRLLRDGQGDGGVEHDTYKGEADLVSRFRLFEENEHLSHEDKVLNYLSMYAKDPLTKPELVDQMMKNMLKDKDVVSKFQVKRSGKDLDDFYYSFGKVHGLENIAIICSGMREM